MINGALPYMTDDLGLTPFTEGMVTSSLLLGAALGAITGGRLSDARGRRRTILVLAVVFFVGALGCTLAPNTAVMVVARFVLGLAVATSVREIAELLDLPVGTVSSRLRAARETFASEVKRLLAREAFSWRKR